MVATQQLGDADERLVLERPILVYQKAAKSFYKITQKSIESADPNNPGVQPRPAPGIQFVGIPEFTKLGTDVSQGVSAAIAGRQAVDSALTEGQELAEEVAKNYRGK